MDHLSSTPPILVTFKQIYSQNISPKLQNLDLLIKTTEGNFSFDEISLALDMSKEQILKITTEQDIQEIKLLDLFTIISYSSSYICGLIKRQWKYASTPLYTPYMIAYIYQLNIDRVQLAFDTYGKEYILETELMDIFHLMNTPIYTFY